MKIDAKVVADHLSMVAMGKRITEVVLGPNFTAQVADDAERVMMYATVKGAQFKPKFGVMDLGEFVKILASFGEEVDIELTDGKLVMTSGGVTVWYQTADIDKIASTISNFKEVAKLTSSNVVFEVEPEEGFLATFMKYKKLIDPDLADLSIKGKKLVVRLSSQKGNSVEVVIGTVDIPAKKKKEFEGFKCAADVLFDVLSRVKPNEEDQLKLSLGYGFDTFGKGAAAEKRKVTALRITFRSYSFLLDQLVDSLVSKAE